MIISEVIQKMDQTATVQKIAQTETVSIMDQKTVITGAIMDQTKNQVETLIVVNPMEFIGLLHMEAMDTLKETVEISMATVMNLISTNGFLLKTVVLLEATTLVIINSLNLNKISTVFVFEIQVNTTTKMTVETGYMYQ